MQGQDGYYKQLIISESALWIKSFNPHSIVYKVDVITSLLQIIIINIHVQSV